MIDYLSLGIIPALKGYQTHYLMALVVGIPMAVVYYFVFRFAIRRFDYKTPGRGDTLTEGNTKDDRQLSEFIVSALGGETTFSPSVPALRAFGWK